MKQNAEMEIEIPGNSCKHIICSIDTRINIFEDLYVITMEMKVRLATDSYICWDELHDGL